jgi:hypothetical protein
MTSWDDAKTVAIRRCATCNRESTATDNFCRWCGANHGDDSAFAAGNADSIDRKTTLIKNDERPDKPVSSPMVGALTRIIEVKTGSLKLSRFGALALSALIVVPIWLLIVLLSPIDAYVSARAASSQMIR